MPMRFATSTGQLIDVYQVVTQMTDESGQSYPFTINSLLDRATGPEGYDGAFCAKPANYARSKYPWKFGDKAFSLDDARKRCLAANPSVGCEKQGEIIYAKCKAGYNKLLLDWCTKTCPADMGADIGESCTKKSYPNPTPWGRPLSSCADGREKQGLLCYEKCKTGYTGNLNVCST